MATTINTSDPAVLCVMCNEMGTLGCGRCGSDIHYCSKECQKMDWPLHKLVCKTWKTWFANEACPLPGMVRSIWFSESEEKPRFMWWMPRLLGDGRVENVLATGAENTTDMVVFTNAITHLDRPIAKDNDDREIFLSRDIAGEGAARKPIGGSTDSFSKIDTELTQHMAGRVHAYGYVPAEKKFISVNMADLRYVVDFVRWMYDKDMRDKVEDVTGETVKGVRVNCLGDFAVFNPAPSEQLNIAMPAASEGEWNCPAAQKIGLPIVVVKCEPGLTRRGRTFDGAAAAFNADCSLLTTHNILDRSLFQGRTMKERDDLVCNQGTIIVARQDSKALHPVHLQAMSEYFKDTLLQHEAICTQTGSSPNLTAYFDSLSGEGFLQAFAATLKMYEGQSDLGAGSTSPYDI